MAGRWLLKTEPEEWSWEQQHANGGVSHWDGVRNAQAQKHLRAMAKGDLCFFYHSGAKAKEIVGITRVCKTFYPDPSDPASKHGMIDIEAVSKLVLPLPLSRLKQEDRLHSFIMLRQPRLSVVPVGSSEWELICELAGELEPPLDDGTVSLKVCNGDAKASPVSSDDNGTVRMRVNKQDLELSDGETRVSLASMNEEMKLFLPEENADFRVPEQVSVSCNDETRVSLTDMIDKPSQSSTVHRRARRERPKVIDGSRVKATGAIVTSEGSRPRGKSRVTDVEIAPNSLAQNCLDKCTSHKERSLKILAVSQATEPAPDAKRVYSRRNKKPRQLAHEGETPTYCDNLQFAAEQEAEQKPMPTSAKISDSRAMVSDTSRVYKKRDRKQILVESLLC